jgi:hypothetical protein
MRRTVWGVALVCTLVGAWSLGDAAPQSILLHWDPDPLAEGYIVSSCQTDFAKVRCRMVDELAGQVPATVTTYQASLPTNARYGKCYTVASRRGTMRSTSLYWICVPPGT